jgi:hypothetical protein
MVDEPSGARKRIRDYAAERERRNIRARAWGFSSLDDLAKARRAGQFPTAREIQSDPRKRYEAELKGIERVREQHMSRIKGTDYQSRTRENAKRRDDESAEWSRKFSRQKGTAFKRSWSAERKEAFYQAFVAQWRLPNDERDFDPTYDYMMTYGGFDVPDIDHNPYSRQ